MFALVQWTTWCVDVMHHMVHKVVKHMGEQTSKVCGVHGVRGVCTFLIAKNAPKFAMWLCIVGLFVCVWCEFFIS